ncbi:MAG: hypothetical protein IPK15_04085 [Verrucomicrobia bacterium]|nr:hypothetical protein [Verrucomicrobiota bacterium]
MTGSSLGAACTALAANNAKERSESVTQRRTLIPTRWSPAACW